MNWEIFNKLKFHISENQKNQLIKFKKFLQVENKKYNLTNIVDDNEILYKHFFDCLIFTNYLELSNQKILDIGSGAGFPGIVLKIIFPNIELHLVESNLKKTNFLNMVITQLKLKKIFTHNCRAENFSKNNCEQFDIVISRATAPLNILLELGVQALKLNGYFVCLKSKNYLLEINELNKSEKIIGLKLFYVQNYEDDFLGQRNNLFYKKNKKTPLIYPRNFSQIRKRPLGK